MKFKHKELFVGIVLGAMIFGGISIFADGTLNVYPNPFKITVNGVEKDIEGYNINEYSYFKLRDIGEQVGFDVDFKEDTIMIENNNDDNLKEGDLDVEIIDSNQYLFNDELYYVGSYINDNFLSNTLLIENIPCILHLERRFVSEEYLNNTILPLDKQV